MRKTRGCKDCLLLDRLITQKAQKNKSNIALMWIDYKKAYESVPHSWIIEVMTLYKIQPPIINLFQISMANWRVILSLHHTNGTHTTAPIHIRIGIFQGDSFSLLIFCLSLITLTSIPDRSKTGVKVGNKRLTHLLYMDDLKTYAENEESLARQKLLIADFSDDIAMSFGLDKCATLVVDKGYAKPSTLITSFPTMDVEERYRYLGMLEGANIDSTKVKDIAKKHSYNIFASSYPQNSLLEDWPIHYTPLPSWYYATHLA